VARCAGYESECFGFKSVWVWSRLVKEVKQSGILVVCVGGVSFVVVVI